MNMTGGLPAMMGANSLLNNFNMMGLNPMDLAQVYMQYNMPMNINMSQLGNIGQLGNLTQLNNLAQMANIGQLYRSNGYFPYDMMRMGPNNGSISSEQTRQGGKPPSQNLFNEQVKSFKITPPA
ncbi:unnamed protein product [Sphagnum balticum]